jgi:ubiquinone/menaquinone biosynthesis C-methylase UbiE
MVRPKKKRNEAPPRQDAGPPAIPSPAIADDTPGILVEFRHGMGDLIQLSIVLAHLADVTNGSAVDVVCSEDLALSKTPFERQRFGFSDSRYRPELYRQVLSLGWEDCTSDEAGWPLTKVYHCLTRVVRVPLRRDLWRYTCEVGELPRVKARRYLESVSGVPADADGRFPVVAIHNRGYSSRMHKDLPSEVIQEVVNACRDRGLAVMMIDLERENPLTDQRTVFAPVRGHPVWQRPGGADPETLLALIDAAAIFIGIDSGPLHLAGASSTPAIGVWTHHHPIRFYDLAPNVLHLVPPGHQRLALGSRSLETFERDYRHVIYGNLSPAIIEQLDALLTVKTRAELPHSDAVVGLRATTFEEDYYREHLISGLDYLGHGEWQRQYGRWLGRALGWAGRRVLDVGCACGSILRGLGEAGIVVQGIDVSHYMIQLGGKKWPDMAPLMHVADAENLSLFPDASWDGLHSAQVAEHWRPDHVPAILAELARVTKPGGLFFCCLDTEEMFARQGREMKDEDPTHVCVKPLTWWFDQLQAAGWEVCSAEFEESLRTDLETFLTRYDWDWFVARRVQ